MVADSWEDNDVWCQAQLIGYQQLRDYEEQEERSELYKFLGATR